MALDAEDQRLLAIVLEAAAGNEQNLHYGLDKAMRSRSRSDSRNYGFVRRLLEQAAKAEIRKAKKKRSPLKLSAA